MIAPVFAVRTIGDDQTLRLLLKVLFLGKFGEAPFVGDDDLLSTGELVLGTTQSFDDVLGHVILRSDGQQDLLDVDTSDETLWFTESTPHTSLKSVVTINLAKPQ